MALLLSSVVPAVAQMTSTPPTASSDDRSICGYVGDGDYKASYEVMDLYPPVTWLTEWMFA